MSKIYLKGVNKPVTVKRETAETLNRITNDESVKGDKYFTLEGVRFCKNDIRYIIEKDYEDDSAESSDKRSEENESYYKELNLGYIKSIEKRCFMPVEEKSKNIKLFETLFFGVTGKTLNEAQKNYVIATQKDYFTKNPRHPFAKVNYFKLLKELPEGKDDWNDIKYHVGSSSLRMITGVLEEAFRTAHQQKFI